MSELAGGETTKVRMWLARVAGPPTAVTASNTSRAAPVAVAVPRFRTVTTTSTSLLTTGSDVNWMSADVIARSGQGNRVKVRARMLFASFVSRTAPPSSTKENGGSTTADTVRLDSRAPFGCQTTVTLTSPFVGTTEITISAIHKPLAV